MKEKRAPYIKVTLDQKAVVGKYAADHGMVNAFRRYQADFLANVLKKSTIRGWRDAYRTEVELQVEEAKKRGRSPDLDVKTLPKKKMRMSFDVTRKNRLGGSAIYSPSS